MFLLTLFVAVAQASSVLEMFFDVLALEFVENIDDVIFELSKRGEVNYPIYLIIFIVLKLTENLNLPRILWP
jgi:hypothetical protein